VKLIGAFTIEVDDPATGRTKSLLRPSASLEDPGVAERLVIHKNYRGFAYEENHVEEWIARQPSALFGDTPVQD
jgi:hypothetical protein